MHVSTETTIADTVDLTAERHKLALSDQRAYKRLESYYAGARTPERPRQHRWNNRLRQVLVPGKRKAARHPWANRLEAARTGGFVIDQTHTDSNVIVGSCYACGHRFGFVAGDDAGEAAFDAEVQRHKLALDGIRGCQRGVEL